MNPKFADDRLSAYLDGTLSTEESTEIRQELARDHELRSLVDELRQARGELQSLPRVRASVNFADRVMAAVGEATMQPVGPIPAHVGEVEVRHDLREETLVTRPTQGRNNTWQAFLMGVTAASLVGFAAWAVFLRDSNPTVVVNPQNNAANAADPKVNPPAPIGDRTITVAQLAEALKNPNSQGQTYLLRVRVSNNVLLKGEIDEQLKQAGLAIHGSMNNRPAIKSAEAAVEKLGPVTAEMVTLPVDEVVVMDGSAEQLAAALRVWTEQSASSVEEVIAVDPAEKIGNPSPDLNNVAVRITRKPLYRAFEKSAPPVGENPEDTSDVLVLIRVK
jgi:negative regulator of sigma E activity